MKFFCAIVIALCFTVPCSYAAKKDPTRRGAVDATTFWNKFGKYLKPHGPETPFSKFLTDPEHAQINEDSARFETDQEIQLLERKLAASQGVYVTNSAEYNYAFSLFLEKRSTGETDFIIDIWHGEQTYRLLEIPVQDLRPTPNASKIPFALFLYEPTTRETVVYGNAHARLRYHISVHKIQDKKLVSLTLEEADGEDMSSYALLLKTQASDLVSDLRWKGGQAATNDQPVRYPEFASGDYPKPRVFVVCEKYLSGKL